MQHYSLRGYVKYYTRIFQISKFCLNVLLTLFRLSSFFPFGVLLPYTYPLSFRFYSIEEIRI